ncbi:MAG: TonB family protein [Cyanobacterium sp. T60_A2020_053]|nr:TonB family protein [Cyanobacterium sp. T60_A2020_053]
MTYSVTCIEQRQQEADKTRKLITMGVIGSIAIHGVVLTALNSIEKPLTDLTEESKPIEFIIVKEPEIKKPEIKEPEIKPEVKPKPKQELTEVKPPQPQKVETSPSFAKTEIIPPAPSTPEIAPSTPEIAPSTPEIAPEVNPTVANNPREIRETIPQPTITPTPQPQITAQNPAPITPPQQILTSNTMARNNTPRAINPVENSNNSLRSNFTSPTRVENNHSSQPTNIARIAENSPVSSGRLSRPSGKTPNAISNSKTQGESISNLKNSLNRSSSNTNNAPSTVTGIPNNIAKTSQSVPQRPQPKPTPPPQSIKCISNCNPSYPAVLAGVEGKTTVKVNLDNSGNVAGVSVVNPHSNGEVNRQALLAAQKMRFSSPGVNNASVQVSINFTVAGSDFDRIAREKQKEKETQARLEQDKERQERQAQLEKERLERQRQLEKERQEREAQAKIEREKRAEELRQQQLEKERQERENQIPTPEPVLPSPEVNSSSLEN